MSMKHQNTRQKATRPHMCGAVRPREVASLSSVEQPPGSRPVIDRRRSLLSLARETIRGTTGHRSARGDTVDRADPGTGVLHGGMSETVRCQNPVEKNRRRGLKPSSYDTDTSTLHQIKSQNK
jgi:hypothetical protein